MTSVNNERPQESRLQRRLQRLKNSIRKRLPWSNGKGRSSSFETALNKIMVFSTGRIRCHGNLFDLKHPRMIDGIREALEKGTYEWREIAMIDRHVQPDDRVVELGACLGATSMFLYDRVGKDGLVVFEADPRNLEMAQHNFKLNRKHVRCENAILWSGPNRPETVSFGSNENPSSSSLLDREGNEVTFDVQTKDFETALGEHQASVIVLDIEGGEIDLFNNADDLPSVRLVLLETHSRIVGESANNRMVKGLENRGFLVKESMRDGDFLALERLL